MGFVPIPQHWLQIVHSNWVKKQDLYVEINYPPFIVTSCSGGPLIDETPPTIGQGTEKCILRIRA